MRIKRLANDTRIVTRFTVQQSLPDEHQSTISRAWRPAWRPKMEIIWDGAPGTDTSRNPEGDGVRRGRYPEGCIQARRSESRPHSERSRTIFIPAE
jgi:hypothetical protein